MTEPLRHIVLLVDRVASADQVGSIKALVGRLGRRGFAARVVCSAWAAPSREGLDVEECRGLDRLWQLAWSLRSLPPPVGPASPALIHALQAGMAPAALEIAERWRIPYLQSVEEFRPPGSRLRLSRRWCRGLIATSRELGDDLIRDFGVPGGLIRVVHRGIEPPESIVCRRSPRRAEVSIIGAAGPLVGGSGFSTFLNAARRVLDAGVDAEFVLVGEGEEEGELRRRADRLRLTERLTLVGDDAVGVSFWDLLDVYCQPSIVPTVGGGLSRAMAHGLPSVASDIEGLRALVGHERTGLRVPPGDTNALARAVLDLLADPPRASGLGLAAREAVLRDCDPDREADALAGLYREVIGSEPPR